jgi:cytochrome c biogenesis protein CcdA
MVTRNVPFVSFIMFVLIFFSVGIGHSIDPVPIEFLWYEPCAVCPGGEKDYQIYLHNRAVIIDIQRDYSNEVMVEWIQFYSQEGREKGEQYNLSLWDWNTIVVNYEAIFSGYVNETEIRELIDVYLHPPPVHDIAVLSVVASDTSVQIGETLHINVTIKNEGNQNESFNVTTLFDSHNIQTKSVEDLEPDEEQLLMFHWATQNVTEGNYTISAHADIVKNETDIDDNQRNYGIVEVRAPFTPPTIIHDVAVISVIPSSTSINKGDDLKFTLTIKNNGTETESFNVSTYYNNEFLIETSLITDLSPKTESTLNIVWHTASQTPGNYTIKAWAEPVANEEYLENNHFIFGEVEILPSQSLAPLLILAFSFGFFETFSPCLIIMLSFVLTYSISEKTQFRKSFTKVMLFGIGFVSAAALLGLAAALVFLSLPTLQTSLTLIVCIFAIIFGLNLLGIFKLPFQTKSIIQKLAEEHKITLAGILIIGFFFYFLDPCIAPIFISMVRLEPSLFSELLPQTLLVFSIGAIIPFIGIGALAGSISKLARGAYRHKRKIRAVSGLILIVYAIYLLMYLVLNL